MKYRIGQKVQIVICDKTAEHGHVRLPGLYAGRGVITQINPGAIYQYTYERENQKGVSVCECEIRPLTQADTIDGVLLTSKKK